MRRIGKKEKFRSLKKRDYSNKVSIIVVALISIMYFAFNSFFPATVVSDTLNSNKDIYAGFARELTVNLLFGYLRERILMEDESS